MKCVSKCKVRQQKHMNSQQKSMKPMKNDRPYNPTMTTDCDWEPDQPEIEK